MWPFRQLKTKNRCSWAFQTKENDSLSFSFDSYLQLSYHYCYSLVIKTMKDYSLFAWSWKLEKETAFVLAYTTIQEDGVV